MSKTFKALQRAAKERASQARQEKEPRTPDPPQSTPSAGKARVIALQKALAKNSPFPPPPPEPDLVAPGRPSGEMDTGLRCILEEALIPMGPNLSIGDDGWLDGDLDIETCRDLLEKYGVLHCLREDPRTSYWFWASRQESWELADWSGL